MRELIAEIFARHLSDPAQDGALDVTLDAAPIDLDEGGEPFMTTDGFIVQPLEFPGGDIGSLAINGTVNDLAVSGATPKFLSLNAFIEEGLEIETLERIVKSLAAAARRPTSRSWPATPRYCPGARAVGSIWPPPAWACALPVWIWAWTASRPGDCIVVSGPIGDHGIAVMLAREDFEISGDVRSDCGNVIDLARVAMDFDGLRFMRDPTRAGLAGVCYEIAQHAGVTVRLQETEVPVRDSVKMVCEMLGYDPYYLACEGRAVAIIAAEAGGRTGQRVAEIPCWRRHYTDRPYRGRSITNRSGDGDFR